MRFPGVSAVLIVVVACLLPATSALAAGSGATGCTGARHWVHKAPSPTIRDWVTTGKQPPAVDNDTAAYERAALGIKLFNLVWWDSKSSMQAPFTHLVPLLPGDRVVRRRNEADRHGSVRG